MSGQARHEPLDTEAALRALAHPGRRRALQLVSGAPRSSGELAEACGWTRPATSQHLRVLRDAGLIEVRKQGQRRLYLARQERLAELRAFLDDFWGERLGELGNHLDERGQGAPAREAEAWATAREAEAWATAREAEAWATAREAEACSRSRSLP